MFRYEPPDMHETPLVTVWLFLHAHSLSVPLLLLELYSINCAEIVQSWDIPVCPETFPCVWHRHCTLIAYLVRSQRCRPDSNPDNSSSWRPAGDQSRQALSDFCGQLRIRCFHEQYRLTGRSVPRLQAVDSGDQPAVTTQYRGAQALLQMRAV